MSSAFLSGLAGSLADTMQRHHEEVLGQQIEAKRNLLNNYNVLLSDPHMADVHGDIAQAMLAAAGMEPGKLHKQIGKPGGQFDPTQWQVLAQQRAAGQVPSPVNQGQNPTQVAPPPVGQMPGQGMQLPSWNEAAGGAPGFAGVSQNQLAVPPPPGAAANPTSGAQQNNPAAAAAASEKTAQTAGQIGNMNAKATGALPPVPGNPAPNAAEVAPPSQAIAVSGPPPVQYGPMGSLPYSELQRRQIEYETNLNKAKYGAENEAMLSREKAMAKARTEEAVNLRNTQVEALKTAGIWNQLHPREQAAILSGIPSLGNQLRPMNVVGMVPGSAAAPGTNDIMGNPIDPNGSYKLRQGGQGETEWVPQQIHQSLQWVADPNDPQKQILMEVNPYNPSQKSPVTDMSKFTPAMIPRVSNQETMVQVKQPDGSIALVPKSSSSSTSRVPSGAPPASAPGNSNNKGTARSGAGGGGVGAPPPIAEGTTAAGLPKGSRIVGGQALTEEQKTKMAENLGALDNTQEIIKNIQKQVPLLDSLLSSGKIKVQIDPSAGIIHGIITHIMPMTPEEEKLAADFSLAMEHINTLRLPLGGAGFRSEEAFNALQALRGNPMQRIGVINGILAGTSQALNRTRTPMAQTLKRAGFNPNNAEGAGGQQDVTELERGPDGKLRIKK
jgi:hypothetical protein